jgi:hypothetical protein
MKIKINLFGKIRKITQFFLSNLDFSDVRGPHWTLSRAACLVGLTLQWSISPKFYKHLLRSHSFAKKLQSQSAFREKLCETHSYEKAACKMLVKLTPRVNFINILRAALECKDPLTVFLRFWDLGAYKVLIERTLMNFATYLPRLDYTGHKVMCFFC